jgi:hypothetical protein
MPLARIITESVDDSLELSMQLRARGFRVETVAPDQIPDSPADLEVRLEECAPEDVLSKAAQVKETEDLWVFVAPGALDERARPVRIVPLVSHAMDTPAASMSMSVLQAENNPTVESSMAQPEDDPILSELELAASQAQTTPEVELKPEILATHEKDARIEAVTALVVPEQSAAPPAIAPIASAEPTEGFPSAKAKAVVLPKMPEVPWIPDVPVRVDPANLAFSQMPEASHVRTGPYKITFRTGPRFWKRAAVSTALLVLAGMLTAVVVLRPHLPAAGRPGAATAPPTLFPAAQPSGMPQASGRADVRNSTSDGAKATGPVAGPQPAPVAAQNPRRVEHPRRHEPFSEEEIIAEDTVVFYDRKALPSPRKTPPATSVKRRSDMN